jgi:hypothetical protein
VRLSDQIVSIKKKEKKEAKLSEGNQGERNIRQASK